MIDQGLHMPFLISRLRVLSADTKEWVVLIPRRALLSEVVSSGLQDASPGHGGRGVILVCVWQSDTYRGKCRGRGQAGPA